MGACSAHVQSAAICRNGFIQSPPCWGESRCSTCKKPSDAIPACMRDELPAHWINGDGSPAFYDATPAEGSANESP